MSTHFKRERVAGPGGRERGFALIAIAALVGATLWGCPQPIQGDCGGDGVTHEDGGGGDTHGDGGGGGNTGTDAGADAGIDAGGGDDAGSRDAGTDAGVISRADAGPFSWGLIPGTISNEAIYAVHGSSPTNVYIASDSGKLRRSTGGAFTDVYVGAGSRPPRLYGVWVTPERNVFAGGEGVLIHCTNGACTQTSDFVVTPTSDLTPPYGTIQGLCGLGTHVVYASGGTSSAGRLWKFDFAQQKWKVAVADTGAPENAGCWVAPNGEVFIAAGYGRMVRVDQFGIPFVEQVNPQSGQDPSTIFLRGVWGTGDRVFATGTRRRIIERDGTTNPPSWNFVFLPNENASSHDAIAGTAPDEIFAGGFPDTNRKLTRFNGTDWTFVPDAQAPPYQLQIHAIWAATPDIVFMAGEQSFAGAVIRGTR